VPHDRITEIARSGLTFDVDDQGPLDGAPVVLLHGFPQRSTCWRSVAPLLHGAGLRTFAMDQRGYAPRARPRRRRDYRLDEMVADAGELVDAIGGRAHVVGHDWGGAVGWGLASDRPEAVATLTSVSTPHVDAFLKSALRSRQILSSWYMLLFQLPVLPEQLGRTSLMTTALSRTGMSSAEVQRFRDEVLDDGAFPTALMWYRGMPLSRPGSTGRIAVPTTLVWSDGDDAISRPPVEATAEYVDADYRLVVLEGVSHWIPSEAPAALAAAVIERVR
jgi:pimeloyl-ACP methyl ester carboxylesterase